ncbi:MAG: Ig domain-containing protein, partial [Acidobacteriaceae bacterium]
MKSAGLGLLCALVLLLLVVGCGGGGNTPPPTPVSITTTTLTQGTTNSTYTAALAASGGSGSYTWSLASGSTLPAGLSLSSAGVVSGTPTTAGLSKFTVNVQDSETTPQSASAPLQLAISGGELSIVAPLPVAGQVGVSYSSQANAQGGVPPYTWSTIDNTAPPPGLTLSSSGAFSGTPTTAGNVSFDLQVTDSANHSASQNVSITINAAGTALPDGSYSFSFGGVGPKGAVALSGSLLLQSQKVALGYYDENIGASGAQTNQQLMGGSVMIGSNGLGQLTLTIADSSTVTFALAVPASIATEGNDTNIRIIEFDDKTGSGTRGSGVLKTSTLGNTSAIINNYAFSLTGVDASQNPIAIVGSFKADGAGNITGYAADTNDNGAVMSETGFTGTYAVNDIRGTMQFKLGGNTYNYSFYQVTPHELLAISTDTLSANVPLVSGIIDQQTGTFGNSSLSGAAVLQLSGLASISGALLPDVTLGLFTGDGNGNVSVAYDEYKGQLLSPQTFTGTYSVDATSGRVALKSSGTPSFVYLLDNNQAFVLGGDSSVSSGLLQPQSGSNFTNASFKGSYLGGSLTLSSPS